MKNYRRILAVVLTVILSVCLFVLPVMAATETANGLELTLVTDKAEYTANEQITASLTVKNTTDAPVTGLVIKHQIPEGIKTVSGDVEKLVPSLGAGESVTLDVVLKADAPANTGDFAIAAVAAALVLSAAGLVFLSKDAKVRKGAISVFVCCVMVAGLVMAIPMNAKAAELSVSTAVKVNGKDVTLSAAVEIMEAGTYSVVDIAQLTNGTVTADKVVYTPGETVTLSVNPNAGYFQKLYINGEPLMLDWKSKTYTFTATEALYEITGSFEPRMDMNASDWGRWDDYNQAHGVVSAYYPNENESWWFDINGEYTAITAKVKNYLPLEDSKDGNGNTGFAFVLRITMDNGKFYAFRIINDKGTYAHDRFGASGSATGWGSWKNIHSLADAINGDGVDYKLERTGDNTLTLSVNGTVMETYTMDGVTAANKVVSVGMRHYGNKGQQVEIPFALTVPGVEPPVVEPPVVEPPVDENAVELKLPTDLEHGSITADKDSYQIGDTVTLTIAPEVGYFQKLYINGEPLMLGWKTKTYSFTATEESYDITGSFVRSINHSASDWGRWDDYNQGHGILRAYYPNNNDSWWMTINGDYKAITVRAKNYLPIEQTVDNFNVVLRVTMDNGRVFTFRVYTDPNGSYAYNRMGIQNAGDASVDWGNWRNLSHLNDVISGEGTDFKLERTGANILTLSVNGEVLDTYTMAGVTAENKVASVAIKHQGNQGQMIEIPFELD